jgi:molecular chaperone GrpE
MSSEEQSAPQDESETSAEQAEVALDADLAELILEREKLRDVAQRVQADFENYRKRMVREQTEHVERANEQLLSQLLPVLDNFELALASSCTRSSSVCSSERASSGSRPTVSRSIRTCTRR